MADKISGQLASKLYNSTGKEVEVQVVRDHVLADLEAQIEKSGDELEVDLHAFKMVTYSPVQLESSSHNLISKRNTMKTAVM